MPELTIWKFYIETTDRQIVRMPASARILTVQTQGEMVCLWALVNPKAEEQNRAIRIYGTGHPVPEKEWDGTYIGTYQLADGALVFHVFCD